MITYDDYDEYNNARHQIIEKKEAAGSTVNIEKKEIWTEYGNSAGDAGHIQGNASKSTIISTGYYDDAGSLQELFLDMQVIVYNEYDQDGALIGADSYDNYGNATRQTITKYTDLGEGVRDLWVEENNTDYWRLDSKEITNTYGDRGEHFGNVLTSEIISNDREGTFIERQVIVYDEEPAESNYDVYGNAIDQTIRRYSGMDESTLLDSKNICK